MRIGDTGKPSSKSEHVVVKAINLGKLDGSQKHSYAYVCQHAIMDINSDHLFKCKHGFHPRTGKPTQTSTGIFTDVTPALSHYRADRDKQYVLWSSRSG